MKIDVPVIIQTDVLVVGGTLAACALAVRLRRRGVGVYCVTPYSYFGEDFCADLSLDRDRLKPLYDLGLTQYNRGPAGIKQALDSVLIAAGVDYLYQGEPVAALRDGAGRPRGALFAGRSGFFAVRARAVVNGLKRNVFAPPPDRRGPCTVSLVALGGVAGGNFDRVEPLENVGWPRWRVEKNLTLASGSPAELARIDLDMRTRAWCPEQLRLADECAWGFARPAPSAPSVFADTADAAAVAEKVRSVPGEGDGDFAFHLPDAADGADAANDDGEAVSFDTLFRWRDCPTVPFELNRLPAGGDCEVLVCGAGTGGAPAAIAAGRAGARTLCVEKLSIPGGVMTAGRIASYYFGNCRGFTETIDRGVGELAPAEGYVPLEGKSPMERKAVWLTRALADSGCEVRFNTFVVGALRRGRTVTGALLAGPWGVHRVTAKVSVDASGNADLAAAAGAPTRPLVADEPAVQGTGLPPYEVDHPCFNTDYTFACDGDVVDATAAFTMAHDKFAQHFDVAQMLDTRERRRIVGDLELQPTDFFAHRQYRDTVVIARSNFDTHGFVEHPMFLLRPTGHQPYFAQVPYRALLPRDWEGVLATGLGLSAHRDCMPLIRMQPDVQNQGYAAGLAAAMAARSGTPLREISVRALQEQLVAADILPAEIAQQEDSFAGIDPDDPHNTLAAAFLNPEPAVRDARRRLAERPDTETAAFLAFLGDATGRDALAAAIAAAEDWDEGWEYRGMGQFGRCASRLDVWIMAAARIGGVTPAVLEKLSILSPASEFSHFRAVCLYFMAQPTADAADALSGFLQTDGFSGHALSTLNDVLDGARGSILDTRLRNAQLKEVYVAKALSRCAPDSPPATRILTRYQNARQTHYALFAAR